MGQSNCPTTLQQRLEIWERAQRGETDPQIAATMQLKPETVRKWRRRAQPEGRSGLASQRGRSPRGLLSQASAELRQTVREWRRRIPAGGLKPCGWNVRPIRASRVKPFRVAPDWPPF
jgi:hypothetical protein